MKTRIRAMALSLVATCALCCSLPLPAFAADYDNYSGYIWTSTDYLRRTEYVGEQFINVGITMLNSNWAALGQSPAYNAAVQALQADYLRATYFLVSEDLYTISNWLDTLDEDLENILDYVEQMDTTLTTLGTLVWQIQGDIENIDGNLETSLDNQLAIGTAVGNINTAVLALSSPIASISSKLTDVLNKIDSNAWHNKLAQDVYNGVTDALMGFVDDSSGVIWNSGENSMGYSLADWMTIMLSEVDDINTTVQSGIDIANWPQSFVDLSNIESLLTNIYSKLSPISFASDGGSYFLRVCWPWYAYENHGTAYVTVRGFNDFADDVANYLESIIDNILDGFSSIEALLAAGNVQDAVGDFNDVQFDANIDTLTSRIATLAPFGAVLMVAAELDMLQTRAVASPEMDLDFDFAGSHEVVHIDLSYLDTVQPFINWIVIILLVYGLLWYTVDFVKLEAAS